jgi:divalent metal cation (Fe/Co/Zn/Cd) transporter
MVTILLIVLIVLMFAGGPYTGWHPYGYWPSGLVLILVVVLIVFMLSGRL